MKLLTSLSLVCLLSDYAFAHITSIKIEGNYRIEPQTIESYLDFKVGDSMDAHALNTSVKKLFETGLFSDVTITPQGNGILIRVVENNIMNRIVFEGNDKLSDEILNTVIGLRPREAYTQAKVLEAAQKIREAYRLKGRYGAKVEPKTIKRDQGRVDVVFEIDEGKSTGIRQILFIGNKHYSDSTLESTIMTKETRWYRFFTSDDTYDKDRLEVDKEFLRRFYLSRGYADFQVLSSVAELAPDQQDFYITFTLDEGDRYQFGKIDLTSEVKNLDPKIYKDLLSFSAGEWYNNKEVEKSIEKISSALGESGKAFVEVEPKVQKNREKKTVDVTLVIKEAPKVYVNRIIIEGNERTNDDVIRREFRLSEGDPFNAFKLKRSEQRLNNLDFFNSVDVEKEETEDPDKINIRAKVEDKSTGELSFGAGYSTTDGPLGEIKASERNLLGRGQELRLRTTISKRSKEFQIGFSEPYFLGRRLEFGTDVFRITRKKDTRDTFGSGGYDSRRTGVSLSLGYELNESLLQTWGYTLSKDRISGVDTKTSSRFLLEQVGTFVTSALSHSLFYDKRDNRVEPTEGYYAGIANDWAGLGGKVRYLKNGISLGAVHSWDSENQWIISFRTKLGLMNRIGRDIRIADRYELGGSTLRGFAEGGVGPRDMTPIKAGKREDALGGTRYYAFTLEQKIPFGLSKEIGIHGLAFIDGGSIWNSTDKPRLLPNEVLLSDGHKLRLSAGVGLAWNSPLGRITVTYAKPIKEYKGVDKRESFRLSFGTDF